MNWAELISTKRQLKKESDPADWQDHPISEFEKDYRDIVTSAAFRRLQDKTQVFPLDQSDFVRTRLTHSLEVSSFAKSLAQNFGEKIIREEKYNRFKRIGFLFYFFKIIKP